MRLKELARTTMTNKPEETPVNTTLLQMARDAARKLFLERQADYFNSSRFNTNETWRQRGMGYTYFRHSMILAALAPENPVYGRNVVRIFNTLSTPGDECQKWTLWVRVNGPELFAGSASAVTDTTKSVFGAQQKCHWEFPFKLQVLGEYEIDVRILSYNGNAPPNPRCEQTQDFEVDLDAYPVSVGFFGFKFYSPESSCCDICTREPGCRYWTTPPLSRTSDNARLNGCELFFDHDKPVGSEDSPSLHTRRRLEALPYTEEAFVEYHPSSRQQRRRRLLSPEFKHHPHFVPLANLTHKFTHGKPHREEVSYFAGCGWSFWHTQDFPCLDNALDDGVVVHPSPKFYFREDVTLPQPREEPLPMCTAQDEAPISRFATPSDSGRWVRLPWNMSECKPMKFDKAKPKSFEIVEHDGENPVCWHRDDLSKVGWFAAEVRSHLEHHHPWVSSVHKEKQWFGVWKRYNCDYLEFTDDELQQCVDERNITRIRVTGASIAEFLECYFDQRLRNITFFDAKANPQIEPLDVTVSTFRFPHILWHETRSKWNSEIRKRAMESGGEGKQENYFVTGFYYTSEREPYITVEHAEELSLLMQKELIPMGWHMINGFDVTAVHTFDAAGQHDGVHMIGPGMKMIVTKFFHHLCGSTKVQE